MEVKYNDVKSLRRGLEKYNKKVLKTMQVYGETSATSLENEAKKKAKWTDRTGQARNSIKGTYTGHEKGGIIRLEGYAVKAGYKRASITKRVYNFMRGKKTPNGEYFQYLEYARNGKYSILRPTVDRNIKRITATMQRRVAKIKLKE